MRKKGIRGFKPRPSEKLKKGQTIPHEKVPLFLNMHFLKIKIAQPPLNLT
jgi:hypothetical protein